MSENGNRRADQGGAPETAHAQKPVGPTALYIVGALLLVATIVKLSVIGYYDREMPWIAALGISGFVLVGIAKKWGERA